MRGFTLLELAIVLVVMGLLVAATLAGRELLQVAKLQSIISESESYLVAVNNFKTQYEALPGDIKIATSFWTTAQNGGTAVANGDGNGNIGVSGGSDHAEPYYAWSHLTLSKYVQGTFSGSSGAESTLGVNVPASKYMDGVGYVFYYMPNYNGYVDALGRYFPNNWLSVGGAGVNAYMSVDKFTPTDTQYIDSKIDDGTPDFGKMLATSANATAACTSGSAPNIIYNNTLATVACSFMVAVPR